MKKAQPFLKWAGGKRQLLPELEKNLPEHIKKNKKIDLYIEPFVGGGAFFFFLSSEYFIKKAIINDINSDLMLTYKVIQNDHKNLIKKLKKIEKEYRSLEVEKRKDYFYTNLRKPFNKLKISFSKPNKETAVEKVALLIALNKTCFNGLFRQNSKGEFNVPFGAYKNPTILGEKNIIEVHKLLQNTEILCKSYNKIKLEQKPKAFVYFDPPYRPIKKSSSFTKYSKEDFDDEDQKKLAKYYTKLAKDGHFVLLSNSDPQNYDSNDWFFEKLYDDYNIQRVIAKRSINCNGHDRGNITELLIKNY
jgi:DNA adenine methylase